MGSSLHAWDEVTVQAIDWKGIICFKECEDSSYWWQGHSISFLGCTWDNFDWLTSKKEKIKGEYYAYTSVIAMAIINESKFQMFPHAPYSPDLALSDYILFSNLEKWLNGYFEEFSGS